MTHKVLFVDDLREPAFDAVVVREPDDAIWLLGLETWDEVWLDWDLGPAGTVRPVGSYIERRAARGKPCPVGLYVVHTANPVGASWLGRMFDRWQLPWRRHHWTPRDGA